MEYMLSYRVKKGFYGWLAYDSRSKFIIDFVIGGRGDDTLEEFFKKLKRFRGRVKLVLIDGLSGL